MGNLIIADFDFSITEVVLARKFCYTGDSVNQPYSGRRAIAGIVYCEQGEAEYCFNNSVLTLRQGEMLFLPECSAYTICCQQNFNHITVNFHMAADDEKRLIQEGFLQMPPQKVTADAFGTGKQVEEILRIWEEKRQGFRVRIKSLLCALLCDYFILIQKQNRTSDYFKVRLAKQILDARYFEQITVPELARACGFSETHFRRTFEKVFHCSPMEYRLEKRLLKAQDLLLSGELCVSEVAAAVGFPDANYFSRVFKARIHINPSLYCRLVEE